jgi:hypothetical protein
VNKIVGLCGRAGSGKTSIAQYLQKNYEAVVLSFADPLRDMLAPVIDQLTYADLDTPLSAYFNEFKEDTIEELGASPRKLLQDIGALMREHNEDAFVNLAKAKINMLKEIDLMLSKITGRPVSDKMTYVIDDVRYDNEARWIKESDGYLINIHRPENLLRKVPAHHSENGVNPDFFDFVYENDDNIETIKEIANNILLKAGIYATPPQPIIDPKGSNRVH